jgi:hypothetical protein
MSIKFPDLCSPSQTKKHGTTKCTPYWNKKRGGEGLPLVFFSWCKENLVIDKRTRAKGDKLPSWFCWWVVAPIIEEKKKEEKKKKKKENKRKRIRR